MPRQRRGRLPDVDAKDRSGAARIRLNQGEISGNRRALDAGPPSTPQRSISMCDDLSVYRLPFRGTASIGLGAKALRDGFFTISPEIFEFFPI